VAESATMKPSLFWVALALFGCSKEATKVVVDAGPVIAVEASPTDAAPTVSAEDTFHLVVPSAPAAGAPRGELVLRFDGATANDTRYQKVLVTVGAEPEKELKLGEPLTLGVPVGMLRMKLGAGEQRDELLVPVAKGDRVSVYDGRDKGWSASRYVAAREGKSVGMKCAKRGAQCPRGYYAAANEAALYPKCGQYYCVEAPKVRLSGPFAGKATITPASPDGELGEPDQASLGPGKLEAGESGPWVLTWATDDDVPEVHLEGAEAFLLVAAGEQWDVKKGEGGVEAKLVSE
jgi:hypothetical protein